MEFSLKVLCELRLQLACVESAKINEDEHLYFIHLSCSERCLMDMYFFISFVKDSTLKLLSY